MARMYEESCERSRLQLMDLFPMSVHGKAQNGKKTLDLLRTRRSDYEAGIIRRTSAYLLRVEQRMRYRLK